MAECKDKALANLIKQINDADFSYFISLINGMKDFNISNFLGGIDFEGALKSLTNSLISKLTSDALNFTSNTIRTSFGGMLATILSSGKISYLVILSYILNLLSYEYQRRIAINEILNLELYKIELFINIISNIRDKNKDNSVDLQKGYDHIFNAYTLITETANKKNYIGTYKPNDLTSASEQLENAKLYLKAPIADTLLNSIKDSSAVQDMINTFKNSINSITDPRSNVNSAYSDYLNNKLSKKDKKAKAYKTLDDFSKAVGEVLNLPGALNQMIFELGEAAYNIGKYLPLDPTRKMSVILAASGLPRNAKSVERFKDLDNVAQRPLKTLNNSIKTRIKFLSEFETNWDVLINLGSFMSSSLNYVSSKIKNLITDIEPYVPFKKRSKNKTDVISFNSIAAKSAKMVIWKNDIDSIEQTLNALKKFEPTIDGTVSNSYIKLNEVLTKIKNIQTLYENDGIQLPHSEGIYTNLILLISEIFNLIPVDKNSIKSLRNKLSEVKYSIAASLTEDSEMILLISNFITATAKTINFNEMYEKLNTLLEMPSINNNKTIQPIIEQFKMGNISLLINLTFSTISQSGYGLGEIVKEAFKGNFDTAWQAIKSPYSNIADCLDSTGLIDGFKNGLAAKRAELETKKAKRDLMVRKFNQDNLNKRKKELEDSDGVKKEFIISTRTSTSERSNTLENIIPKLN